MGLYAGLVAYIELEVWSISHQNLTSLHSLLGFVLSLLLVFRTNTAYERWWEGRKQWGELVNNTRNLAMKIRAYVSDDYMKEKETLGILIYNHVFMLKEHLRNQASLDILDENEMFRKEELENKKHYPNALATKVYQLVNHLYKQKAITGDHVLNMNLEIKSLTDIAGACERIKSTPIPYSYSLFIKKFIFVYIVTLPFGFVSIFGYAIIPVVMFIFYVLASIELLAEEIEDPFGDDINDLPTDEIALKIKMNIKEILEIDIPKLHKQY